VAGPDAAARKRYVAAELACYWPRSADAVMSLAIPGAAPAAPEPLPPRFELVPLPAWATDIAVEGHLLAPRQHVMPGGAEPWRDVDWWGAAWWYLSGAAERAHEERRGPIHSYSFRLNGWDPRMWERAWVNRIALFLRRWAAREARQDEHALLGPAPAAEIHLTHDVDAIRKTLAIRFKQSAFHVYNALRLGGRGELRQGLGKLSAAARFLLSDADYWHFDQIEAAETRAQVRSSFFVYGGDPGRRSLKQALLDPGYDVREDRLAARLRALASAGWRVGMHQSYDAWRDPAAMAREKARVEEALGARVTACRQHWLRFSWRDTWKAQQAAGLEADATLGFNDRPGFRNGAALSFRPWDTAGNGAMRLAATPLILMDSHLYDYGPGTGPADPARGIRRWIGEVEAVGGTASVLWHPHTLSPDYGWPAGFAALLAAMGKDAR
jgi:hypothetical protein